MIDIAQFKTLRAELERQATGEETMEDDPFVLLEINEAINNGDGVLSQIDIVRQASGRLKPSTIKTLMDKAQTKRNSRESNAEQFIKTQLGGGGLFAGMDAAKDARTANALMEFWEQKGVYDGDVFDLARKLVDEFKQEPSDPRSLPRSKYLPRGDYSIESVSNAMASIRGKFLRGELTKSQAAIEFKKIKDIKNALEEQSQGASSSMIGSEAKRLMNQ